MTQPSGVFYHLYNHFLVHDVTSAKQSMGDTGQDTGMGDQLNDKLMMNRERTRNERIEDRMHCATALHGLA